MLVTLLPHLEPQASPLGCVNASYSLIIQVLTLCLRAGVFLHSNEYFTQEHKL